jgi:hypothetical protein
MATYLESSEMMIEAVLPAADRVDVTESCNRAGKRLVGDRIDDSRVRRQCVMVRNR